jgi:hypothetical protein
MRRGLRSEGMVPVVTMPTAHQFCLPDRDAQVIQGALIIKRVLPGRLRNRIFATSFAR